MLSKKKLLAGVAGLILIASPLGSMSASAADDDALGVCQVVGGVTLSSASGGLNNTAQATTGTFNSTTLECTGAPGSDDAGTWSVSADFASTSEDCLASLDGSGDFTSGTGPSAGDDAYVVGGHFTFKRGTLGVAVSGELNTSNTSGGAVKEHHAFTAALVFVPTNGVCSNPTSTADTTTADIATGSTAVITGES